MVEYTRQPCPIRIVEDCGCAFMMGTIGGSLFQAMRGFRNAPAGLLRGVFGGIDSVKMKTPAIAGSFAIWGATFSTVDCTMVHYRQQEDSWNSIISGAATGGILAARNGLKAVGNGALVGGLVLAIIEGAGAAVATIYAAQLTDSEAISPKRPEWELASEASDTAQSTESSSHEALAEIERVLDKCNTYKTATRISQQRTRRFDNKNVYENYAKPPPSLLEQVKLANIFKT